MQILEFYGLKFDPDAFSPGPPNICVLNDNGCVLSRRDQKETDSHTGDELNRVLNPTTTSGKIHRSDDMRPVRRHEGARKRRREPLMAALNHGRVVNIADAMPPKAQRGFSYC